MGKKLPERWGLAFDENGKFQGAYRTNNGTWVSIAEVMDIYNHMIQLVQASEKIRHWHDTEDGMVVSAESVRNLWETLDTIKTEYNLDPYMNGPEAFLTSNDYVEQQ